MKRLLFVVVIAIAVSATNFAQSQDTQKEKPKSACAGELVTILHQKTQYVFVIRHRGFETEFIEDSEEEQPYEILPGLEAREEYSDLDGNLIVQVWGYYKDQGKITMKDQEAGRDRKLRITTIPYNVWKVDKDCRKDIKKAIREKLKGREPFIIHF